MMKRKLAYSFILLTITLSFNFIFPKYSYAYACSGGTITQNGNNEIHTFSTNGSYTFSCPANLTATVQAWGAGGGGEASGASFGGEGGGGGAYAMNPSVSITNGTNYTVVVGLGGAGGIGNTNSGSNGGNSTFSSTTVVAAGGGGGTISVGGPGGTVAASTGTTIYAGGSGYYVASGLPGGGGGSSGGTGSNGTTAGGQPGAAAVTGGGPGGNGATSGCPGGIGNAPSSGPGGGGGGGYGCPNNGGAGYDGQIVITVPAASCSSAACGTTNSGSTCTSYSSSAPTCGTACSSVQRTSTCTNGSWDLAPYSYGSCTASCCASGVCAQANQGQTCATYANSAPACGTGCSSTTATCQSNGTWSGTIQANSTCTACCNNLWGSGTTQQGGSVTAYSNNKQFAPSTCSANSQTRTCQSTATFSGSYAYQTCIDFATACSFPSTAVSGGAVTTISSSCSLGATDGKLDGVYDSNSTASSASNSAALFIPAGVTLTIGGGNNQTLYYGKIQFGSAIFTTQSSYSTLTYPRDIVAADFNGDGKQDLAVANYSSATVSVFLNNGNTSSPFGTANETLVVGTNPAAIIAGDFNGDGKQDLAVANFASSSISVFLNNGTSTPFPTTANQTLTTGINPYDITSGDFNADGKKDLVASSSNTGGIFVFLNNGTSTPFPTTASQTWGTGSNYGGITSADFNADGKWDLAVTNQTSGKTSIYLSNGTSTPFPTTPSQDLTADSSFGWALISADFNGDGKPDLVSSSFSSGTVTVFINNGNTSAPFSTYQTLTVGQATGTWLSAADFNGDGKLDLAADGSSGIITIFINNGNTSTPFGGIFQSLSTGTNVGGIASADFNGDGKMDLAGAMYSANSVYVYLNKLGGSGATGSIVIAKGAGARFVKGVPWVKDSDADGYPDSANPTPIICPNATYCSNSNKPTDPTYVRENIDQSHLSTADCNNTAGAPCTPTVFTVTAGSSQNSLSWSAPPTNTGGSAATGYDVYYCTGTSCSPTTLLSSNQAGTTYTHSSLTNGTVYGYKVIARTSGGTSTATAISYGTPVQPAIARRGAASTSWDANGLGTTSLVINKPTGTVQNDVMITAMTIGQNSTITPPTGWTLMRRVDNLDSYSYSSMVVYYKVAGASEPSSYTWGFSTTTFVAAWSASYVNVNTSTPIDVSNGQTNNTSSAMSTSFSVPSINTSNASEMVVAAFGAYYGAYTWTPPSGMTEFADLNNTYSRIIEGTEVLQASAGASGIKTATLSSTGYGASVIFALKQ